MKFSDLSISSKAWAVLDVVFNQQNAHCVTPAAWWRELNLLTIFRHFLNKPLPGSKKSYPARGRSSFTEA
jgi:hypothetical protein